MSSKSEEQQQQKDINFPTTIDEAEEEEERELVVKQKQDEEHRNSQQASNSRQKRGERKRSSRSINAAAPGRQMTLFDLGKELGKQRRILEKVADDVRQLRRQFNQVQKDLTKFEKRFGKKK